MAELIWLLAFSGQSFHFLSTYFSSSNSAKFPSASAPLKWSLQLPISCRGWLFLKLLYFSNCDGWLMIMERLTLVLFSRSVCTSFWDPPHSQYSLRQRESRYIMIVLYCVCQCTLSGDASSKHTRHTKKKKRKCFYGLSFQADPAQRAYVHSHLIHRAFWVFQLKLHCRDGRNPLFHVLLNYSTKYRGCVLDVIYGKQLLETKHSASLFKSVQRTAQATHTDTNRHRYTSEHQLVPNTNGHILRVVIMNIQILTSKEFIFYIFVLDNDIECD